MKFSQQITASLFQIHAYQAGEATITVPNHQRQQNNTTGGEVTLTQGFIITPTRLLRDWSPAHATELTATHIMWIAEQFESELVLLGTGAELIFPDMAVLAPLYERRIGVEVMSSDAACRTFNILCEEGRQVTAAIML